jgi:DNA invertase Pin-like site-specific DNA recombinase
MTTAALYARYSTDKQSEASIADQWRVCERLAERHGFTIVARYSDAAISGGTAQRPEYQAMLQAARRGEFRVILAEDTSRLWRNLAEQSQRLAELADLGVAVVTQDLDTRSETAAILSAVNGAMSEQYRRELGRRVRRGLEGLALQQKPTGGRAYGYETRNGERVINHQQAVIVREIFTRYAAGDSLREIAADLNVRGIPSPGAGWKRSRNATDGFWRVSALHAMLRNELYAGQLIWNRARWVRSARDSKKRRYVENPRSEWIVHERPDLAIVDEVTWHRVQVRANERGELFKSGPGGRATHLLSGILRCGVCGGAYVISAHKPVRYGCSTNRHAGDVACSNRLLLNKAVAEERILETIIDRWLSPEAIEYAVKCMRDMAKEEAAAPGPDLTKIDAQIAELERLRDAGVLSPEIAGAALARAYRERNQARRTRTVVDPLFGAGNEYKATVLGMRDLIQGEDVPAAREALRAILGQIKLYPQGDSLAAELTAGRMLSMAVNWNGSGGVIWIQFPPYATARRSMK